LDDGDGRQTRPTPCEHQARSCPCVRSDGVPHQRQVRCRLRRGTSAPLLRSDFLSQSRGVCPRELGRESEIHAQQSGPAAGIRRLYCGSAPSALVHYLCVSPGKVRQMHPG